MTEEVFKLRLTQHEVQAVFRACLEYQKALEFSALRDMTLVGGELSHIENVKEKISETFFYPKAEYSSDWD